MTQLNKASEAFYNALASGLDVEEAERAAAFAILETIDDAEGTFFTR